MESFKKVKKIVDSLRKTFLKIGPARNSQMIGVGQNPEIKCGKCIVTVRKDSQSQS